MNKLRSVLYASVAALGISPAAAADLPTKAPPMLNTMPAGFSWTGIYIGAHGGYEFGALDITTNGTGSLVAVQNSGVLGTNPSGGFGGGHIGWNYQFAPQWVIGMRGDLDISGLQESATIPTTNGGLPTNTMTNSMHSVPWHGDVVGRLGYLVTPTVMFYGVGGVAFGEIKDSMTVSAPQLATLTFSNDNVHTGYVTGAGLEWFFNPNMSVGVEWNYYNLGTNGVAFITPTSLPSGTFNVNDKAAWNAIKANLSIKF